MYILSKNNTLKGRKITLLDLNKMFGLQAERKQKLWKSHLEAFKQNLYGNE